MKIKYWEGITKNLKTEQTILCGLEFGPRNEEREKEIEKRNGWFLELCPANLFFYPPDRFRRDDKFQKKMRSIINRGIHITQPE